MDRPKLKQSHRQRLTALAEHLESGKLGHKKFDFALINGDPLTSSSWWEPPNLDQNGCGTNGCALGELPFVFPRHFKFSDQGDLLRKTRDSGLQSAVYDLAADFFGFTEEDTDCFHALFIPDCFIPWSPGKTLTEKATRKQVARNIRRFLKWLEKESA